MTNCDDLIKLGDRDALRKTFRTTTPFPFFVIDGFLDEDFARSVCRAYPDYKAARRLGREFNRLNEKHKIQICDASYFPSPIKILSEALSSSSFLQDIGYITGINCLIADSTLLGGGIHVTGPSGRLDVHVDFNYLKEQKLFRRLNILLYFNSVWEDTWGGHIELWDAQMKNCMHSLSPVFNRCVVFETSEISFHGVTPVTCPSGLVRNSFAAYYYTKEAPIGWSENNHSTIFRARPTEMLRNHVLMPAQRAWMKMQLGAEKAKNAVKSFVKH